MKNRLLRTITTLLIIFFLILWSGFYGLHCPLPQAGAPPTLYANQTDDNLQRTFIKAIQQAEKSIHLYIYSLTDQRIVQALLNKESENVAVTLFYDPSTSPKGISKLSNTHPIQMRGLMHKKILIIDEEAVWIGSANFTTDSLKRHDNLVVASVSKELAATILQNKQHHTFTIGEQKAEYWSLPESAQEGLEKLIQLIQNAEKTVLVAMFTWTHPQLTEAIIQASLRGVHVEAVLDRGQSRGVNKKEIAKLLASPVEVRINRGSELFHHKFVMIDDQILVNGSANWTRSAFGRNSDCFLILHELNTNQLKKLHRLWHIIRSTSDLSTNEKHLMVFRKRPSKIIDQKFESIRMAA